MYCNYFELYDLLWAYKYILVHTCSTPDLSKSYRTTVIISVFGICKFLKKNCVNTKEKMLFHIFHAMIFENTNKDRVLMYRKQYHLIIEQTLSRKSSENGLQYNPLANNICIIRFWIIHRVKRPRGISQHEFSITNRSCKNIMKNICQNAIRKMEAVSKW